MIGNSGFLSAASIAARVNQGELSPVDAVDACLVSIGAYDKQVKAWTHYDAAAARSAAQRLIAVAPGSRGSLAGVAVGVKDIIDVAGMPTGLDADFARFTPAADATTVARLRAAGAIILGKTATTQFAHSDPTTTRNPWDLAHTPGGSSSGSAAAVAAGMATAAIGTQTIGSVLRPAAYCGIVGLKPTHGRTSLSGVFPVAPSLDHVGVFGRSVADAALLLSVLAVHDPLDPQSVDRRADDYVAAASADGPAPTIAVPRNFFRGVAEPEVSAHIEAMGERFAAAGALVTAFEMPETAGQIAATARVVHQTEAAVSHQTLFDTNISGYRRNVRELIEAGRQTLAVDYLRARTAQQQLRQSLSSLLINTDVMLLPTAPSTAPRNLNTTGPSLFCAPASLSGLPSISLPSGLDAAGMPLAVQLVAKPWQEAALLRAAAWVEEVLDFHWLPPLVQRGA